MGFSGLCRASGAHLPRRAPRGSETSPPARRPRRKAAPAAFPQCGASERRHNPARERITPQEQSADRNARRVSAFSIRAGTGRYADTFPRRPRRRTAPAGSRITGASERRHNPRNPGREPGDSSPLKRAEPRRGDTIPPERIPPARDDCAASPKLRIFFSAPCPHADAWGSRGCDAPPALAPATRPARERITPRDSLRVSAFPIRGSVPAGAGAAFFLRRTFSGRAAERGWRPRRKSFRRGSGPRSGALRIFPRERSRGALGFFRKFPA